MELKDKRICIIGAGKSGMGAIELLKDSEADVTIYDAKPIKDELPVYVKKVEGEFPEDMIGNLDLVVISPGVPTDLPFVNKIRQAGVPIWGELELAYHFEKGTVLAITGTNGKTTTTALLGHIMKCWNDRVFVVGNIGDSYASHAKSTTVDSITVAEVSSFQLESIVNFHPMVSAILNITPDHLNRHHTMECYIETKENITLNQDEFDTCVLNYDDEVLREFGDKMGELGRFNITFFSSTEPLENGVYIENGNIVYDEGIIKETVCSLKDLKLIGKHNHENIMAGIAMAIAADVPLDVISEAVTTFTAVPHRIEYSGEVNGVIYYNDSKGTNTDAAIKGIQAMDRPTYLIGGGYDKGADYTDWIKAFDGKVKKLVLIGATRENIRDCAEQNGFTDCVLMDTFEEAFAYCAEHALPGDAVLLSPACASWGMFDNYEQRGDVFKKLVSELSK